jgi:DNA-binding NarL/FixJ family response regulator
VAGLFQQEVGCHGRKIA